MKRLMAAGALALLSGCATLEYYAQAVEGHLEVMRSAVPIEAQIRDPGTPKTLREKLERVLAIREFATRELALPDNGSFRSYADLGRPFALWNVFAAPEFSVTPVQSCFLFAGCVAYRGFYSERDARDAATELGRRGYDVFVGGVPAYSTLGWFEDPVLSTYIRYPDTEVARIIFHELAHQVVYVKDDTEFNESFAAAVEDEGVRRWLEANGTPAQLWSYEHLRSIRRDFAALVLKYRGRLEEFYARTATPDEKRAGKRRLFSDMEDEYRGLRTAWGGFSGYDRLFSEGVNNATLAAVATYTGLVPAFRALLAREHGDLPAFYGAVRALARSSRSERDAQLAVLRKTALN